MKAKNFKRILIAILTPILLCLFIMLVIGPVTHIALKRILGDTLGTPVEIGYSNINPYRGSASFRNITTGNPPGFSSNALLSIEGVEITFSPVSLLSRPVVIHEITIQSPGFNCEFGQNGDNISALIARISARSNPQAEETTDNGYGIVIESFEVIDGTITYAAESQPGTR